MNKPKIRVLEEHSASELVKVVSYYIDNGYEFVNGMIRNNYDGYVAFLRLKEERVED